MTVLGILLGIGVPSFQGMMRQEPYSPPRPTSCSAAAAMARSEAVKRGTTVTTLSGHGNEQLPLACANADVPGAMAGSLFSDTSKPIGNGDIDGAAH